MLLYFTLSLIIIFLGRLLTAFITIKLSRKKDLNFSDISYKTYLFLKFLETYQNKKKTKYEREANPNDLCH